MHGIPLRIITFCTNNLWYVKSNYILQPPKYLIIVVIRFRSINDNFTKDRCSIPMDKTVVLGRHKFSLQATTNYHYSGHYTASINCCSDSPYFEATPPTTVNKIQVSMMQYRLIRFIHMYIDIPVDCPRFTYTRCVKYECIGQQHPITVYRTGFFFFLGGVLFWCWVSLGAPVTTWCPCTANWWATELLIKTTIVFSKLAVNPSWYRVVDTIITVTSWLARWRLKSTASPLFTQSFIRAQIKDNIKAPCH